MTSQCSPLADLLAGPTVATDGGLATELQARGYDLRNRLWSARLLAEDPDAILDVHLAYYAAGARVAISASYQASRQGFHAEGIEAAEADALLRRSVLIANHARCQSLERGVPGPLLVAASVGPYGAVLHDGSEYRGRYDASTQHLTDFHRARLDVLAASGADLLAIETIPDVSEAEILVSLLAQYPDLPAWFTYSCADAVKTCAGQPFEEAVAVAVSADSVVAVGVNCTRVEHVEELLGRARAVTDRPLVAYPRAHRWWDASSGTWDQEESEDQAALLPPQLVRRWADSGAALVGGCCGLGPPAIAGIAAALADR
jgi:homocysteine S-methyltransferase